MAIGEPAYVVELDPISRARLLKLMASGAVFSGYYTLAMRACVSKVVAEAQQKTTERFQNPTGTLMRNIVGEVRGPWEGYVGVSASIPYARRREFGFSGMTDRLGRYYADDPGDYYLRDGLRAATPFIEATFFTSTRLAVRTVAEL